MKLKDKCKELAQALGTQLEIKYCPDSKSYDIQIPAPDGKQWVSGQCIHLTVEYYTFINGGNDEAYLDLINRMKDGLEDIDETINPQ